MLVVLIALFVIIKQYRAGLVALTLFGGFHLIEIYGKYFVHHPPPPQFMLRTIQMVQFAPFTVREVNSYPSGHSGRTMFISVILFIFIWQSKRLTMNKKLLLSFILLVYDITMMVSRVYLGEHWTSDVIGGAFLGSALGLFAAVFLKENAIQSLKGGKKKSFFPKYKIEVKRIE